jgi:ATP-dependent Clp protease ATP-binding subunit ClpB
MNINKLLSNPRKPFSFQQLAQKPGQQQIENEHIFKAIFEVDENVAPLF